MAKEKEEEVKELEVVKEPSAPMVMPTKDMTPNMLLQMAVSGGADVEKLEKLMELQERHEKNEARKAYVRAMTAFKNNPPKIDKDKAVGYSTSKGDVGYKHATLWNVTEKINEGLSKHGLSASWTTKQDNGNVTVTCVITHELGHSESTSLTASPDTSGSKNGIQAIGSTISYLERYTVLALTGLATHDMDDDGVSAETPELCTEEQSEDILMQMTELDVNQEKFFEILKIKDLSEMTAKKYEEAVKLLEKKRKAVRP